MGFGSQALILAVPFLSVWPGAKHGTALSLFPQLLKKEQSHLHSRVVDQ